MRTFRFGRLLIFTFLAAAIAGCSSGRPSSSPSRWAASLEQIRSAVSAAGGYSPEAVEVTASPTLLHIAISDATLAQADQVTRGSSANAFVAAAESILSQQEFFASVQAIDVAIMHAGQAEGSPAQTHTEDVLEFRKGPNKRFAHHIT